MPAWSKALAAAEAEIGRLPHCRSMPRDATYDKEASRRRRMALKNRKVPPPRKRLSDFEWMLENTY